jgi:hypothetical protein
LVVAAAVAAAAIVAVAAIGRTPAPPSRDVTGPPSFTTPTRPPAGSVIAYYEVLDADGSLLYERVLDGVSLPRLVVERPSADFSRTYTVDPTGQVALAAVSSAGNAELEAIDVFSGDSLWRVRTPVLEMESAVWSSDGRRWAALVGEVDLAAEPSVLIADVSSGSTVLVALQERAWPQGFASSGALVLTERSEDLDVPAPYRFLAVDPASGGIARLPSAPPVGPHSVFADDVAPARGLAVAAFSIDDAQPGISIQVRELKAGPWRPLATFDTIDRVLFTPAGDAITAIADGKVVLVDLAGNITELWDGPDYADLSWSPSGQFLGVSGWDDRSIVAVVERATQRAIELPLPERIAEARLVTVLGSGPLPANALPPGGDPEPVPPVEPTGPAVDGGPGIVVGWIERVEGVPVGHAEIRVPTEDGGIRTLATMPPIRMDDLEGQDVWLTTLPRPGTSDVLIKADSDGLTRNWLWSPEEGRRPFPFPKGWPRATSEIAWRPDGLALASVTFDEGFEDGESVIVIADLAAGSVRRLAVPDDYSLLAGWWSQDELLMGHDVCTEGCPGRYSNSLRLRVTDGRMRPFGPREHPATPVHSAQVEFDPEPEIILSSINDEAADDVRIRWPAGLPAIDGSIVLWSSPDGALLVGAPTEMGLDLYRIDDPLGRARGGIVERPAPTIIATLPLGAEGPQLSPDARWMLVTDRTGGVGLVELASGRRWDLGPGRELHWSWLSGPTPESVAEPIASAP